ncbi:hypothetical protein B0H14DRAFT_2639990 [Mycena olivaceomarginata]|nr:hypothetical protein B0H14DRAFT_2639990 [Mycena olivaceomarginata]
MPPPGGFPSPAPAAFAAVTVQVMCTPCFHRYPPSALGISEKRGWGTTIIGAMDPGGDSKTYAPPAFQIAPPPVQLGSPASAASSGKEIATLYPKVELKTEDQSMLLSIKADNQEFGLSHVKPPQT